ncbi:MAG: leucine-rich repeat domain-containing protein [Dolichospermum sp.]
MSCNQATDQELLQIIEEAARNKETRLYFDFRQLTILPEAITQLSNLTVLCLRNNQLKTLPESIAQLSNLTALDLSNNQLTTLPESIAQLSNLTVLDLSDNKLTTLPEAIKQLSQLEKLDLRENRLKIPAEILGSSCYSLGKPSEILDYYFPVQTEEQQLLNKVKAWSTTDRQLIQGYIAWEWGLTASLADDHPFKLNPPFPLDRANNTNELK